MNRSGKWAEASNAAKTDALLAKELNDLSFENRTAILDEIHCVDCHTLEETPKLIQSSLLHLQEEIAALPLMDKEAYQESIAADTQYFLQQDLQLKFLRAERFNAKSAAVRLTKNAQKLKKYFGQFALHRPLYFSDLGKRERQFLRLGCYQILPSRDRLVCVCA